MTNLRNEIAQYLDEKFPEYDAASTYQAADAILAEITDALVRAALDKAADMIAEYTTSQHVAHDMRVGIFPQQSPKREAMAGDIRTLADDPDAIAAITVKAGWV